MAGRRSVAIFGGGVAGLSAAQELARFPGDLQVTVYEASNHLGGKAASQVLAGTGVGGRADMPGEHGFRFFPHFYRNLHRSMRDIPFGGGSVNDNLVQAGHGGLAHPGGGIVQMERMVIDPKHPPPLSTMASIRRMFHDSGFTDRDLVLYSLSLFRFLTSCRERREAVYEHQSWWDFLRADRYSDGGGGLIDAITSTMVAMPADTGSARTMGSKTLQLTFDFLHTGEVLDGVMGGPTNDMWIDPWQRHLEEQGVDIHLGRALVALDHDGGRITGARLADGTRVVADHYLLAVPLEVVQRLLLRGTLTQADPGLGSLLDPILMNATAWMAGAQFYLPERFALEDEFRGHLFYPGSDWALTTVFEGWFWDQRVGPIEDRFGDGRAREILSVDISGWHVPSRRIGKRAVDCSSPDEVLDEVWAQLRQDLRHNDFELPDQPLYRHLDQSIPWVDQPGLGPRPQNPTPLLIHPMGSFQLRPGATTAIENLFLASDYVRTTTDLATMESANEAARMAARAIAGPGLRDEIALYELDEGDFLQWARELDRRLFKVRGATESLFDRVTHRFARRAGMAGALSPVSKGDGWSLDALDELFRAEHVDGLVQELFRLGEEDGDLAEADPDSSHS